jgi:hypothetical protein
MGRFDNGTSVAPQWHLNGTTMAPVFYDDFAQTHDATKIVYSSLINRRPSLGPADSQIKKVS